MKNVSTYDESIQEAVEETKKTFLQISNNSATKAENTNDSIKYCSKHSQNVQSEGELSEKSHLDTVNMLVDFLDQKDKYTKRHCERVTKLAIIIGRTLDLSDSDLLHLEFAALLHDIGKLFIPDKIISKEGKLTTSEYEIVKTHPMVGYELIKDISFLDVSKKILLQHHERVDGKGYPMGLADEHLDIKSKILSVADAYDAMTNSRPYRKEGLSLKEAICQMELCSGSQFDKNIVDVFVSLLKSGEAA